MHTVPQFGKPTDSIPDRPCAYALIRNEFNNIMIIKIANMYFLPGGGIEHGETPEQAVIRETKEEAGYTIRIKKIIGKANQAFTQTTRGPMNKTATFFEAEITDEKKVDSTEPTHQTIWMNETVFLDSNASEFYKWAIKNN